MSLFALFATFCLFVLSERAEVEEAGQKDLQRGRRPLCDINLQQRVRGNFVGGKGQTRRYSAGSTRMMVPKGGVISVSA